MDWHVAVAIFAGTIQILCIIPYVRDMLRGATRPNLVSWSLWGLATGIATAAQFSAGASWSIVLPATAVIINITVISVGLFGYGYRKFGWVEVGCLTLSLMAILLWQATSDPLVALLMVIAADAIAYIPTFAKSIPNPQSETPILWLTLATVGVLSGIASTKLDIANLAFPVYYFCINIVLWAIVFFGQRLHAKPIA